MLRLKWFNLATSHVVGEQESIVNLTVAFETPLVCRRETAKRLLSLIRFENEQR